MEVGSLCDLRKQSARINNKRSRQTPAATDIPIMAPVESFLDFLWVGTIVGWIAGVGAGDGKNGVHGGSGPPQRSMFPANEDALNLPRVLGIEPLS